MTQKDFRAIAYAFALTRPILPGTTDPMGLYCTADQYATCSEVWRRTRDSVADQLAAGNPRFKRELFNRATEAPRKDSKLHGE